MPAAAASHHRGLRRSVSAQYEMPIKLSMTTLFVSIRGRFTVTQLQPTATLLQPTLLWHRSQSTRLQPCGGRVIMIMHPVNSGVDVLGMVGMEGVPDITGTEDEVASPRLGPPSSSRTTTSSAMLTDSSLPTLYFLGRTSGRCW